jgi:phosphoribosylcarboxyaminoimidazole (NCAIR) mutase
MRSTHSERLERWLGRESVEDLSRAALGWYGPPIQVANVPGSVFATGDGDFVGAIRGGGFANAQDYIAGKLKSRATRYVQHQGRMCHAGFSSLADFLSEATVKRQTLSVIKNPTTAAATNQTMWRLGFVPPAGVVGANIPGGAAPTNTTTGAIGQSDAPSGDQQHITTVSVSSAAAAGAQTLLLYDRTFHAGNILHTTTGNQAVSGVPTRYATTTSNGTFITLEVTSALGTTAHTATITYTDQDGNAAEAGAAATVTVSSVAERLPLPQWFYALNANDNGARTVTNIAFSAVSSGISQVVQGKPLMFIPAWSTNVPVVFDGVNSCFNFVRVLDGACLALFAFQANANAGIYALEIVTVSG